MRYERTDCALMCVADKDAANSESCCKYGDFKTAFTKRYQRELWTKCGTSLHEIHTGNAEVAVREMLKEIAMKVKSITGSTSLTAEDNTQYIWLPW